MLRQVSLRSSIGGSEAVRREAREVLATPFHRLSPGADKAKVFVRLFVNMLFGALIGLPILEEQLTEHKKKKAEKGLQRSIQKISLEDVIGVDDYKFEVEQVVDFFKNSSKYKNMGADVTKGVLLYGKPGVGKTMLAKALASESSFNFLYASGSEFSDKYFGGTSKKVRELFREAEKKKPCVIFIDEIDSIGAARSDDQSLQTGSSDGLNQLLHEMDGFNKHNNIIVVGATNRFDSLDPALLRPGRFDSLIEIPNLNEQGRMKVFDHYLKKVNMDLLAVNKDKFIGKTQGFTGADIKNALNLAAINAGFKNKAQVEDQDLQMAVDRILNGNSMEGRQSTGEDIARKAYSEAALAIVANEIGEFDRVNSLSLSKNIFGSQNLGLKGRENSQIFSKTSLWNDMRLFVTCTAAEEIIYGPTDPSFNCTERMKKARSLAKVYVQNMNDRQVNSVPLLSNDKSKSNQTLNAQEHQISKAINSCIESVKKILVNKAESLQSLSSELIKKKSMTKEAVQLFL
jgi:ATP-dependent metalloprotease FtsH